MFEYIVGLLPGEKNAKFDFRLGNWWISHYSHDVLMDVILFGVVGGVVVYAFYSIATFSIGGV